jgi:uncharacterized membrane protein
MVQQTRQDAVPGSEQHTASTTFMSPGGQQYGQAGRQSGKNNAREKQLARALGWFSIGLGLAEVAAPRGIAKLVGVRGEHRVLIRLLGMREITHGIGILTQRPPVGAVWSRVGGDAIDLACLGAALTSPYARRNRIAAAMAAILGVTCADLLCAQQLSRSAGVTTASGAMRVQKSIIINRSPEELYRFWRDFQNLPRFMYHLESVRMSGTQRSHWVAKAPAGKRIAWDAETTADEPNTLIAWRALEDSDVHHTGSVRFEHAPGGRGTVVTVEIAYRPPGGVMGVGLASLFGQRPSSRYGMACAASNS